MALDINGYNDTFRAFTDFAAHAKSGSTFAQISGEKNEAAGSGPLAGRTIVAKTGFDFVGNVGRRQASRDVNNAVRDLFKSAIADLFGGEDKIPDSVRDAMKMADFGKGKPLTARRILAVKSAVEQIAEKAQTSIEECKAKFKGKRAPQAHALLEPAFHACGRNPDAMDIVKENISKLVYTGGSDIRTAEQVQKKVGDLVASLDELKAVSKDNPGIYAAGKQMLKDLGKGLPAGTFAKLVKAVGDIPMGDLRRLSGSSSGKSIHRAVMQFCKSLNAAMASSGADKLLEGDVYDVMCARTFMTAAALSGCGKGALGKIGAALNSDTARNLVGFYAKCVSDDNPYAQNESEDVRKGLNDVGTIGENYLRMLNQGVNFNLQRLNPAAEQRSLPVDVDVDLDAIGGDRFVEEAVSSAKDINAANVRNLVDQTVMGGGKGAEVMKDILHHKLAGAHEPMEKLGKSLSANANAMMNWNICGEMKKLATGDGASSQFAKDIYRGTNATLTDGKTTIKLTQNFETARDELAQFVTGDPKATYNGITDGAVRNKVHLLMAIISQETEKATENGAEYALDTREADSAFSISGFKEKDKQAARTYTIQMTDDGGIAMHYVMDKPIADIDDGNTEGDGYEVGEGSKFVCKLDYTLDGKEVNRLAELDYGKFDDREGYQIFNRKIDMPDGTRQFREHKLEKVVDSFPEEFKVKADCRMDFTLTLNPTVEEEIAAQRGNGPIVA